MDDGVIINSAALWPLLAPQWKDPKKWWKELAAAEGKKDYDWSHLAARYFPKRVDAKCQSLLFDKRTDRGELFEIGRDADRNDVTHAMGVHGSIGLARPAQRPHKNVQAPHELAPRSSST